MKPDKYEIGLDVCNDVAYGRSKCWDNEFLPWGIFEGYSSLGVVLFEREKGSPRTRG